MQYGHGSIVGWGFPVVGINLSEDFETFLAERTGAWHTAPGLSDAELIDRRRLAVLGCGYRKGGAGMLASFYNPPFREGGSRE